MATPHIQAERGDFAETILMPGDPLRAQYIAAHFLENVREVNRVRNMLGYTGHYRGQRISVMGHGMGIPSTCIYAHELINDFGVRNLIRVGSCGAVLDDVRLRDIIIGIGAGTDSRVNRIRFLDYDLPAIADFGLAARAVSAAHRLGLDVRTGSLFSADQFYSPEPALMEHLRQYGILGVEMEAAGLYGVAAAFGARALTVCTVSDHMLRGESLSAAERESTFNDMIRLTLESVLPETIT